MYLKIIKKMENGKIFHFPSEHDLVRPMQESAIN